MTRRSNAYIRRRSCPSPLSFCEHSNIPMKVDEYRDGIHDEDSSSGENCFPDGSTVSVIVVIENRVFRTLMPAQTWLSNVLSGLQREHPFFRHLDSQQCMWSSGDIRIESDVKLSSLRIGNGEVHLILQVESLPGVPAGMFLRRVRSSANSLWHAAWLALDFNAKIVLVEPRGPLELRDLVVERMRDLHNVLDSVWDGYSHLSKKKVDWNEYCREASEGQPAGKAEVLALAHVFHLTIHVSFCEDLPVEIFGNGQTIVWLRLSFMSGGGHFDVLFLRDEPWGATIPFIPNR